MMTLTEPFVDDVEATDGSERRRGLRIRQTRPLKIFAAASSRYFGGQTCDISATGLRIELPAFATVRLGETVTVHVGPNESGMALANRRSMMPARVVWIDRSAGDRTMEAGVEFISNIAAHLDAA
ncbi:MAG TPA: PilZ domain-containing protein [Tepidisphaeraceae bacterium]|jgi:c-di-GMP-binding flagellar brake protein YcgR|nr:PilZ domain-containing protein [Tepidisphaeraceae bacterium]